MDLRDILDSVIAHINIARMELEVLSGSGINQTSASELDLAYQSLTDSITHCQGVFGPTTIEDRHSLTK